MSPKTVKDVIRCCPNLEDLALWGVLNGEPLHREGFVEFLPRLKRLSTKAEMILTESEEINGPDQAVLRWSQVTHLDLSYEVFYSWEEAYNFLCLFPVLTHLALGPGSDGDRYSAVVSQIVSELKNLRLVVVARLLRHDVEERMELSQQESTAGEWQKVVIIRCGLLDNWVRGTKGKEAMWTLGEREVQRRQGRLGTNLN